MSTRNRVWLVLGALLGATAPGCASGPEGGDLDSFDATIVGDAGHDADAPDADEDTTPDAETDAALDASMDAALDSSRPDAAIDARVDAALEASRPEASVMPDADAASPPDAAPDTGSPDSGRPVAAPLPTGTKYGEWTWVETAGAVCRDGSPAGYYHRRGDDNLLILLSGSGACMDSFFCGLIPKNVNQSMFQETLADTSLNLFTGPDNTRQLPPEDGILKRDSKNPVAGWSMIFVPYCTGDVHAGSNPDGMVPSVGAQKFVGYTNIGLFLNSFGPSFVDTKRVLFAGSGAGGFGVLLNFDRVQTFFNAQGATVSAITDSGIPFQDSLLEPCLQKRWRDLWNLNAALPKDCKGCFNADGGGLASGLGTYMFKEKYKDRMIGGMVSSNQDEIVKVFFSAGLKNCTVDTGGEAVAQTLNLGSYPADRFPKGISDAITNVAGADNVAYYVINGSRHMHLIRSRYYDQNGVGQSMADWVADILAGKATHRGTLAPLP